MGVNRENVRILSSVGTPRIGGKGREKIPGFSNHSQEHTDTTTAVPGLEGSGDVVA
jgi:hypothetical protein